MRLPEWFRALLITVMLAVCAVTCHHARERALMRNDLDELSTMVSTSRQRETKQQMELDAVRAALAPAQEALEAALPPAEKAKAHEEALRQERKQLRQEIAALESEAVRALCERSQALNALVDLLRSHESSQ